MQTRYKILILLLALTTGALALWYVSGDNEAMVRFRSHFYGSTFHDLKPSIISTSDHARLWYGAVALFAVVVIALTFRAGRRDGPGTRARLIELKPAKVRTGKLLQGSSWMDRFTSYVKDVGFERKVRGLEHELREKDGLLQRQGEELEWLRSKVLTRTHSSGRENELQQELDGLTERLQVNASATAELESRLTAAQELLQSRSEELDALREEAIRLTQEADDLRRGKNPAENFLQTQPGEADSPQAKASIATEVDALNSEVTHLRGQLDELRLMNAKVEHVWQQELQASKALQASMMTAQENSFNEKIQTLESERIEKEELLQNRERELSAIKAKVKSLRDRLAAAAAAKKQVENVLQQQLRKKTELLESKDLVLKESQESAALKIEALENERREREKLLEDRAAAVEALESEVNRLNDASSNGERAKSLLMQDLENRTQLLQAKDAKVKELQDRLDITLQALENAQSDVQRLTSKGDLGVADKDPLSQSTPAKSRPYRKGLNSTLFELGAVKARAAASRKAEEARRSSETDSNRKQARPTSRRDQEQRGRKRT